MFREHFKKKMNFIYKFLRIVGLLERYSLDVLMVQGRIVLVIYKDSTHDVYEQIVLTNAFVKKM